MIKSLGYNDKRRKLARACADALGLKDLPLEFMNLAIKRSDIPEKIDDYGNAVAQGESSLLSMGVVYSYGGITKFIARDGHTYILPHNDVLLAELEKCGYVICPAGSSSPCSFDEISEQDVFSLREQEEKEDVYRKKSTLPSVLVEEILELEGNSIPICDLRRNESGQYIYDVFSDGLYSGEDYSLYTVQTVVGFYGYDNDVVRKLLAITGSGDVNLSLTDYGVDSLPAYIDYAMQNEYMNPELYYQEYGPYFAHTSVGNIDDSNGYTSTGSNKKHSL